MNPAFKAFAAFAAATSALVASALFAAPIPAESRLASATVYPDRAVVSRLAAGLFVPAGTSEVTFSGLPGTLQDESVQVFAKGTVATSLLDIAIRTIFVTAEPDARIKSVEDQLLAFRREERVLHDQNERVESQRALVASIEIAFTTPVPAGSVPPARPALEDYAKLLDFSSAQRGRLDAAAQKLDLERSALAEKIAAADARLNELRGKQPGRRATKSVTLRLTTEAAGQLDISLRYALPGASWTPAYDARLHTEKREVQLDAFGLVRNATGEDWKDITLVLSTARPGLGGAAPEIEPWHVDVDRPAIYNGSGAGVTAFSRVLDSLSFAKKPKRPDPTATVIGQPGVLSPNEGVEAAVEVPQEFASTLAVAELESAATSASFKIATPVTLASDNTPQRVPLGGATLAAELQYQAAPKLQETAYLAAYVTNRSELPFLGGTLNVFLDETFVASSRLTTTMPGEKFILNLGADEGISIQRKIAARFTEDTGFAKRNHRITYDVVITVTNNKHTPERVVITDTVPVARDEKITVKLLAPSERELLKLEDATAQPPKPGIARDSDGKLTWRLDLKPGEKRELPLKFSIEHPADLTVIGIE